MPDALRSLRSTIGGDVASPAVSVTGVWLIGLSTSHASIPFDRPSATDEIAAPCVPPEMQTGMFGLRHDFKVVRMVIRCIAIDVVNDFLLRQVASNLLLCHKAMFSYVSADARKWMVRSKKIDIPASALGVPAFCLWSRFARNVNAVALQGTKAAAFARSKIRSVTHDAFLGDIVSGHLGDPLAKVTRSRWFQPRGGFSLPQLYPISPEVSP